MTRLRQVGGCLLGFTVLAVLLAMVFSLVCERHRAQDARMTIDTDDRRIILTDSHGRELGSVEFDTEIRVTITRKGGK